MRFITLTILVQAAESLAGALPGAARDFEETAWSGPVAFRGFLPRTVYGGELWLSRLNGFTAARLPAELPDPQKSFVYRCVCAMAGNSLISPHGIAFGETAYLACSR